MFETKSYMPSHSDCQRPGTSGCLRVPTSMKAVSAPTAITIQSDELVKETSRPPMWIGPPIGWIWNCSSGDSATLSTPSLSRDLCGPLSVPFVQAPLEVLEHPHDVENRSRQSQEHQDQHEPGLGTHLLVDQPSQAET